MERVPNLPNLLIWAKSRGLPDGVCYALIWHLLDTGAIAQKLWDTYMSPGLRRRISVGLGVTEEHARQLIAFWAALHDLGKATPIFQQQDAAAFSKLSSDPRYESPSTDHWIRHDRLTQILLMKVLAKYGYAFNLRHDAPAFRLAEVLGYHHSRIAAANWRDYDDPVGRHPSTIGDGEWAEQRELIVAAIHSVCGSPRPPAHFDAPVAVAVAGIVILADWLASQQHFLTERLPGSGPTPIAYF